MLSEQITLLNEYLRPKSLNEIIGQSHLFGFPKGRFAKLVVKSILSKSHLPSLFIWGPSGSGKTSFLKILLDYTFQNANDSCHVFSIFSDTVNIQETVFNCLKTLLNKNLSTHCYLFFDQVERLKKIQGFEKLGDYIKTKKLSLICCSSTNLLVSNSSRSLKLAILISEVGILDFKTTNPNDMSLVLSKGARFLNINLPSNLLSTLISFSQGNLIVAINNLILIHKTFFKESSRCIVSAGFLDFEANLSSFSERFLFSNFNEEMKYDYISALQKSIRGSDITASLYYLTRMTKSHNFDVYLYILRRLMVIASEDIGVANNRCFFLVLSNYQNITKMILSSKSNCDNMNTLHIHSLIKAKLIDLCVLLASTFKSSKVYFSYSLYKEKETEATLCKPVAIPMAVKFNSRVISEGLKERHDYLQQPMDLSKIVFTTNNHSGEQVDSVNKTQIQPTSNSETLNLPDFNFTFDQNVVYSKHKTQKYSENKHWESFDFFQDKN
ncbi:uncharacterized protein ASCRUDRAFT_10599 [Ascoidea rubescens DSM 1968]|uniref:MgsA AAA+ ATPase C-terminal domain-containing protein n=1 Tax=Ascoidea rubescens DSM 1968 TaxID=1344418 RepID=A0A1D2V8G9_9ASCO|nr:hypothetical protein ASCRUDRAFT_10599 [Ascoidea rubescens DSM 1968]ODV57991.1 hypothetical protein ASCRUDRAFT_10599 [Ascoidea rubescens DSM 1968]